MSEHVQTRKAELNERLEAVCNRLRDEVRKLELDIVIGADVERANYALSRDPASGGETLVGTWRDNNGMKQGEILFHADGSFFAEYDVICDHPKDSRWFVEAVTAWGRDSDIRSEARLLPVHA